MKTTWNNPNSPAPGQAQPFFRRRLQSIGYALAGIRQFFRREPNAKIHLVATLLVTGLAFLLKVTRMEAIALLLVTGFVWMAELCNTAIEKIMDQLSPRRDPAVQFIKDVAAAAVLVAALTALLTGAFVFTPKILSL